MNEIDPSTAAPTPQLKHREFSVFISYRHADNKEPGRQWATWLHQTLETYEVPPDWVGTKNTRGHTIPSGLYPAFRDEEEFPADAELSAPFNNALRNSRHLIVICSPAADDPAKRAVGFSAGDECFPETLRRKVNEQERWVKFKCRCGEIESLRRKLHVRQCSVRPPGGRVTQDLEFPHAQAVPGAGSATPAKSRDEWV